LRWRCGAHLELEPPQLAVDLKPAAHGRLPRDGHVVRLRVVVTVAESAVVRRAEVRRVEGVLDHPIPSAVHRRHTLHIGRHVTGSCVWLMRVADACGRCVSCGKRGGRVAAGGTRRGATVRVRPRAADHGKSRTPAGIFQIHLSLSAGSCSSSIRGKATSDATASASAPQYGKTKSSPSTSRVGYAPTAARQLHRRRSSTCGVAYGRLAHAPVPSKRQPW
jgi:hypothetical protein